ncbi:unnamed protein product [Absidia cylindrospora]
MMKEPRSLLDTYKQAEYIEMVQTNARGAMPMSLPSQSSLVLDTRYTIRKLVQNAILSCNFKSIGEACLSSQKEKWSRLDVSRRTTIEAEADYYTLKDYAQTITEEERMTDDMFQNPNTRRNWTNINTKGRKILQGLLYAHGNKMGARFGQCERSWDATSLLVRAIQSRLKNERKRRKNNNKKKKSSKTTATASAAAYASEATEIANVSKTTSLAVAAKSQSMVMTILTKSTVISIYCRSDRNKPKTSSLDAYADSESDDVQALTDIQAAIYKGRHNYSFLT